MSAVAVAPASARSLVTSSHTRIRGAFRGGLVRRPLPARAGVEHGEEGHRQSSYAEGDQGVAAVGVSGVKHQAGEDGGPSPKDEYGTALAVTERH